MNKRIRYEDLNWRVVTDAKNEEITFERSRVDSMGVQFWDSVGWAKNKVQYIEKVPLLAIFRSLLDQYTLDQEE